jgi:hypothetical protein
MRGIRADDYRQHMRVRSPRWGTVSLPSAVFRELVRPLHYFTHAGDGMPLELELSP